MEILQQDDIHLKFLLNLPVNVDGIGDLYAPLLKDIVGITENKYNLALSSVLFDRSRLEVSPEQIEHLSEFQLLNSIVYHDASYREAFFCALELHFNKPPLLDKETGCIYLDELTEESILTDEKFNYIKSLVKIANNLQSQPEEFVAGNEAARKFIEAQNRKKAELAKHKKAKTNLHSIISAVGWKSQAFDFINHLNIYQLYNGYARFQIIDNYHYTMGGMYAGTVDGSKLKLEDINWANIL